MDNCSLTGWKKEGFAVGKYSSNDTLQAGALGLMDSSAAQFYGVPTANIKLKNGTIVSATTESIAQALSDSTLNSDNTLTPSASPNDYPAVMPTYMMVPTSGITPEQGAAVANFLRYAVTDGQHVLPAGYAPLPRNLVERSLDIADKIPQTPGSAAVPGSGNGSPGAGSLVAGPANALLNGLGLSPAAQGTPKKSSGPAKSPASSNPKNAGILPLNQGAQLWLVARLAWDGAVWMLPILSVLGLASLVLGPGLEASLRWRRQISGALRRLMFWI
jgi:hypothetical protein